MDTEDLRDFINTVNNNKSPTSTSPPTTRGAQVVVPHAAAARPVIASKATFKEHPSVCVRERERVSECVCVCVGNQDANVSLRCASYYKKSGSGMRLSLLLHTHIVGRTHIRPPSIAKSNAEQCANPLPKALVHTVTCTLQGISIRKD